MNARNCPNGIDSTNLRPSAFCSACSWVVAAVGPCRSAGPDGVGEPVPDRRLQGQLPDEGVAGQGDSSLGDDVGGVGRNLDCVVTVGDDEPVDLDVPVGECPAVQIEGDRAGLPWLQRDLGERPQLPRRAPDRSGGGGDVDLHDVLARDRAGVGDGHGRPGGVGAGDLDGQVVGAEGVYDSPWPKG